MMGWGDVGGGEGSCVWSEDWAVMISLMNAEVVRIWWRGKKRFS